jgi:hypothetical protein
MFNLPWISFAAVRQHSPKIAGLAVHWPYSNLPRCPVAIVGGKRATYHRLPSPSATMLGMKLVACLFVVLVLGGYLHAADDSVTREVPLSSVVSTSYQKGLQHAARGWKESGYIEPYGRDLDKLYEKQGGQGASNVFLADAPDISGAVAATVSVMLGGRSTDRPATLNQPNPPRGSLWLVVYLGVYGSSPPQWIVDSATVESTKIRFAYHRGGAETKDSYQYFYWVPLKTLPSGTYQLELFDTESNAVTLSRRVIVDK